MLSVPLQLQTVPGSWAAFRSGGLPGRGGTGSGTLGAFALEFLSPVCFSGERKWGPRRREPASQGDTTRMQHKPGEAPWLASGSSQLVIIAQIWPLLSPHCNSPGPDFFPTEK